MGWIRLFWSFTAFLQNIFIALLQSLVAKANDSIYFIYTQLCHACRKGESGAKLTQYSPLFCSFHADAFLVICCYFLLSALSHGLAKAYFARCTTRHVPLSDFISAGSRSPPNVQLGTLSPVVVTGCSGSFGQSWEVLTAFVSHCGCDTMRVLTRMLL